MNRFSDKYRVANRFIAVAVLASALGAITHAVLVFFFFIVGVKEMGYYNIFSTLFFILMFDLLKRKKSPQLVYFLISVEVMLHAFLATYFVGYESGFGFFILILLPVFLLNIKWEKWQVYSYFLITIIVFYLLYSLFEGKSAVYDLEKELIFYVNQGVKFATGLMILITIYYFSLIVNQNDQELRRVNKILYKRNEEKTMMMNETHHRVKNNLQMVTTLLRLQSSKIDNPNIVSMFKETQNRVFTIASLHEKMYQLDNIDYINAKEYITRLTTDIIDNFTLEKRITANIEIEDIKIPTQIMIPLSLVINEIITNSLKYAFSGKIQGIIIIKLKVLKEAQCELLIGDNGSGFSYADQKEGLGTKLISVFIEQLEGSISKVESEGTLFKIVFKNSHFGK